MTTFKRHFSIRVQSSCLTFSW